MAEKEQKQERPAIPPPPNGGFKAWIQILGAHLLFFNSWGIVLSYGAFQTYYGTTLLPEQSVSNLSWVGTLQGFLLFFVGVLSGPFFDKGRFRVLMFVGSIMVVFGLMMTSLCTKYYQVFLAQGVCIGIGAGLLFLPSVAIGATYFTTKRGVAVGISAAGGSLGGVIYPIVFRQLIGQVGFGWTTRIMAFIALATLCVSNAVMRSRLPPAKESRMLIDMSAWKNLSFDLFSAGIFLTLMGLYLPFFYIPDFAIMHAHQTEELGFYMVSVLNAASFFGRILPGIAADRFGPLNCLICATLCSAVVEYGWIGVDNKAGLVIFCIFHGFCSGAVVSLPPTVVAGFTPDLGRVGTWIGMSFISAGCGLLIGSPIAGEIFQPQSNDWIGGQVFGATFALAGGIFFVFIKFVKVNLKQADPPMPPSPRPISVNGDIPTPVDNISLALDREDEAKPETHGVRDPVNDADKKSLKLDGTLVDPLRTSN